MPLHRVEIPICMQQLVTVLDAIRPYKDIDRLADHHAPFAEAATIVGRSQRVVATDQLSAWELQQQSAGGAIVRILGKSLQELGEDQVALSTRRPAS